MPQQVTVSVENNFTKGLITESTGLNFPENAATDADNCEFTLIGDTLRREGMDFETNFSLSNLGARTGVVNTYKWNNAGGDGNTQIVVVQSGGTLYFYQSSAATAASPLSTKLLSSTITLSTFLPTGSVQSGSISTSECQFADGNGYLFVYHPYLDPFYCTYSSGTITASVINVQTRDFKGVVEPTVPITFRPTTLTNPHFYNIQNQGWQTASSWTATSTSTPTLQVDNNGNWTVTNTTFTIPVGLPITAGSYVTIYGGLVFTRDTIAVTILGQVSSYSGTSLIVNVLSCVTSPQAKASVNNLVSATWNLSAAAQNNQINTWNSAIGNYPSNADVWWVYKNTSGIFDPLTTINQFPAPTAPASKGHFILNEFNQQRATLSNISTITDVKTDLRPKTGTWFAGRVWFTGVDAISPAAGTAAYTTWTENIYFSQIVTSPEQFGKCYQDNDPTDQNFFDLLPTDGGVISIPGAGSIFKLFPIANGMLVFAGNGVWFITGSQGIGFTASDYTITKLSNIESISSTSFVDVMGLPYFWNEEGIYQVQSGQGGQLSVEPITVGTILTFYNNIPKESKRYVRGAYHPIDYVIQWVYKSQNSSSISDRYTFNKILNYNVYNKAFFPYTIDVASASVNGILFIQSPGGSGAPDSGFKYLSSYILNTNWSYTFSEIQDDNYVDWSSTGSPKNYVSYFVTGYKLRGQAIKKFQPQYVQVWAKTDNSAYAYKIQGLWDYATDRNSNRWSSITTTTIGPSRFSTKYKRHRIRGRGYALQLKFSSVDGSPFDIQGWAIVDTVNTGT